MRLPLLAALASIIVFTGCATATHYAPATRPGAPGYGEQQLEVDRWRVSFVTGDGASPELARDYALLRAAELTLARGGMWFAVANRGLEPVAPRGPRIGIGIGGADFGRHSAVGGSLGTGFGGQAGAAASLEIVIGRGQRPPGADVYDARELSDRLRARLPPG